MVNNKQTFIIETEDGMTSQELLGCLEDTLGKDVIKSVEEVVGEMTIQDSIKLLTEKRGFDIKDISKYKWEVKDEEINEKMTDEQLLRFAKDQAGEVENE